MNKQTEGNQNWESTPINPNCFFHLLRNSYKIQSWLSQHGRTNLQIIDQTSFMLARSQFNYNKKAPRTFHNPNSNKKLMFMEEIDHLKDFYKTIKARLIAGKL
jgi:hypothetical protein